MANPTVINFLDQVEQQVSRFLTTGTKMNGPVFCTSCDEGPSACIYIDPVMRGRDRYGDRVAMRITAKKSVPRQKDGHSVLTRSRLRYTTGGQPTLLTFESVLRTKHSRNFFTTGLSWPVRNRCR